MRTNPPLLLPAAAAAALVLAPASLGVSAPEGEGVQRALHGPLGTRSQHPQAGNYQMHLEGCPTFIHDFILPTFPQTQTSSLTGCAPHATTHGWNVRSQP